MLSLLCLFYRDFVGPIISGAVIHKTNFGWTMTVWFFITIAVIVSIFLLKLYRSVKPWCIKKQGKLISNHTAWVEMKNEE